MLQFVVGLPGLFVEWCDRVVAEIVGAPDRPAQIVRADTLEELTFGLLRSRASHAVIAARHPGGRLLSALAESKRPLLVVLDDPRLAVADLIMEKNCDLASATQEVASACGAILSYASLPRALSVTAEETIENPVACAKSIARHLGLPISDRDIGRILRDPFEARAGGPRDGVAWWTDPGSGEKKLVEGALGGYLDFFTSGRLGTLSWTPNLFFLGDKPGERVTGAVDITGRARCLLEGPHILIPRGDWLMSFTLAFSRSAVDSNFFLEIVAGRQLASCAVHVAHEGPFEGHLAFAVDETVDHPVTIRFYNQRASFDGTVDLVRIELVHQPPVRY